MQPWFFDRHSDEGCAKYRSLLPYQANWFICLGCGDPWFRASWELMQRLIVEHTRKIVDMLRDNPKTRPVGDELDESAPMYPVEMLLERILDVYPPMHSVYDPVFGLDIDPFVLIDPVNRRHQIAVQFFPRDSKEPITAYGSMLEKRVDPPRIEVEDLGEGATADDHFLLYMLSHFMTGVGDDFHVAREVAADWQREGGCLRVYEDHAGEFLAVVAIALLSDVMKIPIPLIVPRYKTEPFQGKVLDASLERRVVEPESKSE